MRQRPIGSTRRDEAGRIVEWFSPGITPEPGNTVYRSLMYCRFVVLRKESFFCEFMMCRCPHWGMKRERDPKEVKRFHLAVISVFWEDVMDEMAAGGLRSQWCHNSRMLVGTCPWHKLRDGVYSHNSSVPAAGTAFSSVLLLLEIIHDSKLIHFSSLCVLCTFPFSLQHNIMQHHHESCQTASWVAQDILNK